MPPKDDDRDIIRHEEQSFRRLVSLLRDARQDVRNRILALGDSSNTALVLAEIEGSINRAIGELTARIVPTFLNDGRRALTLGVEYAERLLPSRLTLLGFRLPDSLLSGIQTYHASLITGVTDDLRGAITRQVQIGILGGRPTRDIVRDVGASGIRPAGPFRTAEERAEAIVRTELNRLPNIATDQRLLAAAQQVPGLAKRWRATDDDRTRPSHREANGQVVPVDEFFVVGGHRCRHPLDPALPASETVYCRCRSVPVVPEDF